MSFNSYSFGNDVTVSAAFKNAAGVAADPDSVYCKITDPDGVVTTYHYGVDAALVKDSTGNYHVLVDANKAGSWSYRFYAIGTGKSADEGTFKVRHSNFS